MLSFEEICREGPYQTVIQRIKIPVFFMSNRCMFVTSYHVHSDSEDGEYTLIRSSKGNDTISKENYDKVGKDVEGDLAITWINAKPVCDSDGKPVSPPECVVT